MNMSLERKQIITELQDMQPEYRPNRETRARMSRLGLVLATGPAGSGKNTVMNAAIEASKTREDGMIFDQTISSTTRDPRTNNNILEQHGNEYFFITPEEAHTAANAGELVQYVMVGPGNEVFYGSRAENYPKEGVALMDVVSSAVKPLRGLKFDRVIATSIIAESHKVWIDRLDARGTLAPKDRAARLEEAKDSLSNALDGNYWFIVNRDRQLAAAANTLIRLGEFGELERDEQRAGRLVAEEMHRSLRRAA